MRLWITITAPVHCPLHMMSVFQCANQTLLCLLQFNTSSTIRHRCQTSLYLAMYFFTNRGIQPLLIYSNPNFQYIAS